ncbi:phosphopantetheine-binding protein [Prosthecobacter sp. SYSU 5D2]|jgi:acyl carrier protein|uniref:acyl carrier protein n=1 Tax=Prosthecobacter sp. SYSU 5D2 TaxID=3134134 RepID=UPI0031FF2DA2
MSDTLNTIVEIIREAVPGVEIDPAADGDRTLKELGIDSLDKMSLLLGVQEKWNLEFSEAEIAELNTINDICRKVS